MWLSQEHLFLSSRILRYYAFGQRLGGRSRLNPDWMNVAFGPLPFLFLPPSFSPLFFLNVRVICVLVSQSLIWSSVLKPSLGACVAANFAVRWLGEVLWSLEHGHPFYEENMWRYEWTSFTHSEDIYCVPPILHYNIEIKSKLDHELYENKTYFQLSSNPRDLHRTRDKANSWIFIERKLRRVKCGIQNAVLGGRAAVLQYILETWVWPSDHVPWQQWKPSVPLVCPHYHV